MGIASLNPSYELTDHFAAMGRSYANLIIERDALPPGAQRRAFEIGFLSRVHQRLCSPYGGNHQARKTCLKL